MFTEDVYIHVKEGKRTRRSADDSFHPETFDLDLTVDGLSIHMHLTRNDQIKTKVPTLTVRSGAIKSNAVSDNEESIFYQDIQTGAVFVMQSDQINSSSMFGVFHAKGEEYIIQSPDRMPNFQLRQRYSKFHIFKETNQNVTFDDLVQKEITETKIKIDSRKRHKRAAGAYRLELLIVVDYSIYQYWYDKSTKPTHGEKDTESITTIRQFYAFIINGMDAMYKNIQTTFYSIEIEFSGIIIAQTPSDSSWTETIKVTSVSPYQVDSSDALTNFKNWVQSTSGSLPGHDHAMLFTRYDLTSSGSTSNAGLAYVGAVCTNIGQSIVEDHFNFVMLTVAAHELGHSLSASHDGEGNGCSFSDAYIMASSSSPQTPGSAIATNPWKFSSCSTNYFTSYIDTLETNSANCMLSLSHGFNATALSEFENDVAGQVYDAHVQCENIIGPGSYLCTDRYSGDFSSICTVMWCALPDQPGYCTTTTAAEGTLCGNQKWCVTGSCVYDAAAPSGSSSCLYGDKRGPIYSNQPWNCSVIAQDYSYNCPNLPTKCCDACAPYLPSTTTSGSTPPPSSTTSSSPGTGSTISSVSSTSDYFSTQQTQLSDADAQCASARGAGSVMCRGLYSGNFSSLCTHLYCSDQSSSTCYGETASDGTLCGNHKWCISGFCTSDVNAPSGDESCLYGDKLGAVFSNGWTCADMVTNAPNNCPNNAMTCCYSCAPYLSTTPASLSSSTLSTLKTTTVMPPVSTSSGPLQSPDADSQCESNRGAGSFMCRGLYSGNFSSICTTLWCSNPSSSTCYGETASDGTLCGNHKWCMSGVCTSDVNAPSGDESCLYGDKPGAVFSNGWTCADMVTNAPNNCPNNAITCCYSCAPYLPTTTSQSSSTLSTLETTSTMPLVSTSSMPHNSPDADSQCESNRGAGSFMCRWCMAGVCTSDVNAPLGDESCLYGDKLGSLFSNGWTCADMVINAPNNCPNNAITCCHSCAPYLTTTTDLSSSTTSSTLETSSGMQPVSTSSVTLQSLNADSQCESSRGAGSFMCRGPYNGDFTSICTTLWCANPTNTSSCLSASVSDGTLCGNNKWCISGVCTTDSSAPSGDESCLYGDRLGPIFTNGWSCSDMVANSPNYCSLVPVDCCYSCAPYLTISTSTQSISTSYPQGTTTYYSQPTTYGVLSSLSEQSYQYSSSDISLPNFSSLLQTSSNNIQPSASSPQSTLSSIFDQLWQTIIMSPTQSYQTFSAKHYVSDMSSYASSSIPTLSFMPTSSSKLPSSSNYAPVHSNYDGSNGNMPHPASSIMLHPSSSNMQLQSSSNIPLPFSSNMPPSSPMLPSSSIYALLHSSYNGTTFSNVNMPPPSSSNNQHPSSDNIQPSSHMLPSSSNYAPLHSSNDGTTFSIVNMPHVSSSYMPHPSSSNMQLSSSSDTPHSSSSNMPTPSSSSRPPLYSSNIPLPSSNNMPPSSHMLPSSSNHAPLHSNYHGSTFSSANMPHESSSNMQPPSSSNMPPLSSSNMPHLSNNNILAPSSSNMQPSSSSNMPPPSSSNMPLPSSSNVLSLSSSNMPSPSSSNMPPPSNSNMPLPTSSNIPIPSSSNMPHPSSSNMPSPSSSNMPSPSSSSTPPLSSSIMPLLSSSIMPPSSHMLPSSSYHAPLHSSYHGTTFSSGNMPHPSSSNMPPPSSSNMPPLSSSNMPPPSSSNMPPLSSSNMPHLSNSNMLSPSNSNMPPSSSSNMPPPSSSNMPLPSSSNVLSLSSSNMPPSSSSNMPPPSSSHMPHPSSSNMLSPSSSNMHPPSSSSTPPLSSSTKPLPSSSIMPPSSHTLPSSSYHAPLNSSNRGTIFSSGNMPHPSSSIMPPPSSSNMPPPSNSNMPLPSISNMPHPSSSNKPPASSSYMPFPSSSKVLSLSSSDMPPSSSSNMLPSTALATLISSTTTTSISTSIPTTTAQSSSTTTSTAKTATPVSSTTLTTAPISSTTTTTTTSPISSSTTTTATTQSIPTTTATTQSIPTTTTTTTTTVAQLAVLNFDSGAVVPFQRVISIVISMVTVGILKYLL
ncbi:unnamed protein product [Mytilus coruscus]|uniref:Peptidase M12B domain-containing protein n=1 Tax=Mytilus coruscus TaxID=42192 RepID=A0A6J8BKW3_MYTCO|nr:unnamed protein product [Mytilus coruscus]